MKTLSHAWKYNQGWMLGLLSVPVLVILMLLLFLHLAGFAETELWSEPWLLASPSWSIGVVLTGLIRYHYYINDNEAQAAKIVEMFDYFTLALVVVVLII